MVTADLFCQPSQCQRLFRRCTISILMTKLMRLSETQKRLDLCYSEWRESFKKIPCLGKDHSPGRKKSKRISNQRNPQHCQSSVRRLIMGVSRKKYKWIWTCCYCGQGGLSVVADPCPMCHYPRCSRCRVEKMLVRFGLGHHHHTSPRGNA
ncbi:hypothetical protein CGCF413_v015203 [Colletotrichum fructicola]|nr:hypothetical protein CGCF413_v015203 [Colletotrichum fructicola]